MRHTILRPLRALSYRFVCIFLAIGTLASAQGPIGQSDRSPELDVLPGFQKPPPGFGAVPFFWWLGDPLTKERLSWILDQMEGFGISGYQINYAHTDKGGRRYGLTMPSEPALFSERWWDLTGWFLKKAGEQGAAISLSDYTLGFGQGWFMDDIVREHPEVIGMVLERDKSGNIAPRSLPYSLNPMHPLSGKLYAEKFFGQFEQRFPGQAGKGLNFFFSDELAFGVRGRLWSEQFPTEFQKRKGYDIVPELRALFEDIGPRTPKIRLDYNDVMVALSEEGFFKPVYDWHQERGMTMGCDHGGRGMDVAEFGDYFRTQRWNQGPGSDQPKLSKNLIKAKVAASIAHLYERPRVWLEGFYGSGWGTTSAGLVDATLANFVMGYDLLSLHGMYYSTQGGWWEWAPPDNTFRMPYWQHLRGFMEGVQRLSYLLSQGHHRCDVAILYPVADVEAGLNGNAAVDTAFDTAKRLYAKGVDLDFIDFESVARAKVVDKALHVSGEAYRVLILPGMKAVRHSTLEKALEFHRAGGIVIALEKLPEASDRIGLNDPELAAMVREIFPGGPDQDLFSKLPAPDYRGPGLVQHRKIGPRDLYAIYNAPKGSECFFRATGKLELWDPWTGLAQPLQVLSQDASGTRLKLPLSEKEIQLVMFSAGQAQIASQAAPEPASKLIEITGDWEFELQPTSDNRFGDFHWPPTPAKIGAEVRQLWYSQGDAPNGPWQKVTCTFGPQFTKSASVPTQNLKGETCEYSWRWGIPSDAGHQGYHGLKGQVPDDLLAIGKPKSKSPASPERQTYEADGNDCYFSTSVVAPSDLKAFTIVGAIKPEKIWLNGELVSGAEFNLKAGANALVLQYTKPGRTYFVLSKVKPVQAEEPVVNGQPPYKPGKLQTRWWNDPEILPFDTRSSEAQPVGWYKFVAPPGLRGFKLKAKGKAQAWVDGKAVDGGVSGEFLLSAPLARSATVSLRIEQERGWYGGATFQDYIQLDCGPGLFAPGDWSANEGLLSYSGGAWYRKSVTIPKAEKVILNLGEVAASAEVRINGQLAGIRVAPPWSLDITRWVRAGENRIEILVCNTLANHYTTIPTGYGGALASGLLGPVRFELVDPK